MPGANLSLDQIFGLAQQQNVGRVNDGVVVPLRLGRGGEIINIDLPLAFGLEGKVFCVSYGTAVTTITTVATFINTSPATNLDIPSGTMVVPLAYAVQLLPAATSVQVEAMLRLSSGLIGAGTSVAASLGPINMKFSASSGQSGANSLCTARQAYTGAGTAEATPIELWSISQQLANSAGAVVGSVWVPPSVIQVFGPASINGWACATTAQGAMKAQLFYAEFTTSGWV